MSLSGGACRAFRQRLAEEAKVSRARQWLLILAAVVGVGLVILGYTLLRTQQQLKAVQSERVRTEERIAQAKDRAAELLNEAANLKLELDEANSARIQLAGMLDTANAAIAELSKELDTAQSELRERQSQLESMETGLEDAERAANQAKAETSEREKQIAKLSEEKKQGIVRCEDFFEKWEVMGAPASLLAIAGLGREAAAAKACLEKGDIDTACRHWQGLLVEIERIGPPVSESRGEVQELMRQNQCEGHSPTAKN